MIKTTEEIMKWATNLQYHPDLANKKWVDYDELIEEISRIALTSKDYLDLYDNLVELKERIENGS
jgi:hypothetical protein